MGRRTRMGIIIYGICNAFLGATVAIGFHGSLLLGAIPLIITIGIWYSTARALRSLDQLGEN